MSYKFEIRYDEPKRHFEEELYLEGPQGRALATAIIDTGATISLIDLEYALALGARVTKLETVVGVSMIPTFIYMVELKVSVIHREEGKQPLLYEKVRELGALPHMQKGGQVAHVFLPAKSSISKVPVSALIFKTGFPNTSSESVAELLSKLVCENNKVVVETRPLASFGVPLLVGVDILKDLSKAGFPIKFSF